MTHRMPGARAVIVTLIAFTFLSLAGSARAEDPPASPYEQWANGPSPDPMYFPIGVWLQSTSASRVAEYQAAGFNLYVGLWQGPTEGQLADLAASGMEVICSQNTVALTSPNNHVIVGWSQQDEPDNAQWDPETESYGPPVEPSEIVSRYNDMKANDATRPVFLNLGQGLAWDGWWGRGVRTGHPEDYPLYLEGTDIGSFDIYPIAKDDDDSRYDPINDKPWMVPFGVDRMVGWTESDQVVWNFVECTNIHGYDEATPEEVRAEVWMSLVHGSMGILYFVHEFDPFIEAGLLADPVMTAAVTDINNRIHSLAPVLNSPTVAGGASVQSSNPDVPVDLMVKHHDGDIYLFAVAMRYGTTTATFQVADAPATATAEVLGEDRSINVLGGQFQDAFDPVGVHLYKITASGPMIDEWEVLADHGAAGTVATTVNDGTVEPRPGALETFCATFTAALDPATVAPGSVTLSGASAGDLSAQIDTLTLSEENSVLTITLSGPLPDGDTYSLTVTNQVTGPDGSTVTGDTDLVISGLAGDTDGSGSVGGGDLLAVRSFVGTALDGTTARYDLDRSGAITGADLLVARERQGNTLP